MIYIERTITIKKNQARIEQPIVLYKGDRNIELQFIIENNPFKYKAGTDVTFGQLVIKRPKAAPIFSEPAKMSSSKVLFIVTGDMIDELEELGNYDFQIRLLNTDQSSRGSLPEVTGGIIIKEPLCEEATVNATSVNDSNAYVMRANNTVMLALDDSDGIFDEEGNYNRTNWHGGDIITDVRLNRVEEALYQINDDIPTDYVTEEYVNDKDRNTRNYVADNYATKVYVDQAIGNIDVDLTGYATEEYVDEAIRNIEGGGNLPIRVIGNGSDADEHIFTGKEFTDEEWEIGFNGTVLLDNVNIGGCWSFINTLVYVTLWIEMTDEENVNKHIQIQTSGEIIDFIINPDGNIYEEGAYPYLTEDALYILNDYATKKYVNDFAKDFTKYVNNNYATKDELQTALGDIESLLGGI